MPRIKKLSEELEMDLEAEVDEATELSLDEEESSDDESEEEKPKAKPAKKPEAKRKPRARKPRQTKEPVASLLESMSTSSEEETEPANDAPTLEAEAEAETETEVDAKEKPAAKPKRSREPQVKLAENDVLTHNMDNMAKQWGTVKEISSTVCANLERVNTMLKEVPTQDLFKPQVARPAAITKIAVGFSALAFVLSLVSLLLSQSARQAIFERAQVSATPMATQPFSHPVPVTARAAKPPSSRIPELAIAKDSIAGLIAVEGRGRKKSARASRRSRKQH